MRLTGSGVPGPPHDTAEAAVSCVERPPAELLEGSSGAASAVLCVRDSPESGVSHPAELGIGAGAVPGGP